MPSVSTLYEDHQGWLRRWLGRQLDGDAHQAADLAQDTFLRLLQRQQADIAELREPRAFLSRIARGLVIDFWRRREIERAWLDALAAQPEAFAPSPEQQAMAIQALCRIDAMLQDMAPRPRQAFILSRVHGLPYAEIALELGVSERMVKRYMADAMLHCIALDLDPAAA
ncbi:sigma-70 family RNA polymerase sigma factor [Xylophilus rhododendri]|nr:sigma-70 family RNA polymerase sigma factor [Xylophilus rhododendri]